MTYTTSGKTFKAKEVNGQYFYWSVRALRWLPAKKSGISA
ncbi:hypothetical protein ACVIRO_002381 [Rhizobium ruizarguesonis]